MPLKLNLKLTANWRRLLLPAQHSSGMRENLWRSLLTFNITRVLIAMVLLVYVVFNIKRAGDGAQMAYWQASPVYLILAIGFAVFVFYYRTRFVLQLLTQIAIDIAIISLLYMSAGGARSGVEVLYLFPLAGGAILLPLVWALFFAASATLFVLWESGYQILTTGSDSSLSQSALYSTFFFASVYLINRLAAKLIKQEDLAFRRGQALQVQEAINRLVIADMGDGILVVGRDSKVQISNPAAERMLGLGSAADSGVYRLSELPSLTPIADAFFSWLEKPESQKIAGASTFVVIKPNEEPSLQGSTTIWGWRRELSVRLKLRFSAVKTAGMNEDRTVIFLQDVTEIENQAQQLKLASMGRLTASIAHEVRNPLSAISYAASLLAEDLSEPGSKRLLNIVAVNVTRLNQMIEDILKLSRKAQPRNEPIELLAFFNEIIGELQETEVLPEELLELELMEMGQQKVYFDPLHLREVVMNLLSNALRYASGKPGSIRVHLASNAGRLELHVQDDGVAISSEVRAHLFEPFYTTSSKGTGLGLYLARELCLNNGAMLDYEYRMERLADGKEEAHGRFVISFAASDNPEYASS